MKKLFKLTMVFAVLSFFANYHAMATQFSSYSFLNQGKVVSIMLTNTIGITNLSHSAQLGAGLGLTNYATGTANTMYTNNALLTVSGTNLPGVLVIDVTTNVTASAGTFGVAPNSASNLTLVRTNDNVNLFQDVYFPPDYNPGLNSTMGGPNTTNLAVGGVLEVKINGTQLAGSGNGSNYVSLAFVPISSDGTELVNTTLAGNGAGAFLSMFPIVFNVTNSASTTLTSMTSFPVPVSYLYGCAGWRLVSATPGVAWSTGGSMWLLDCRLNLYH